MSDPATKPMRVTDTARIVQRECLAAQARGDAIVYFRLVRDPKHGDVVGIAVRDAAHPPTGADWASWQVYQLTEGE